MTRRLPPYPALDWTDDGAPRSRDADDVYFSRAGGLEESRAVFLAGCGLPEAWAGRRRFAIGELGFGAGLNALAAWECWRRTRPPGGVLHFVSIEGVPLDRADAARALAPFDAVASLAQRLLERWPVRAWGPQRLWFEDDGFALTVIHADVADGLAGLSGAFDAWFLDGFSPARNPAMWSAAAMARLAALSAPDARAATYSVAGDVRRALTAAGFTVAKRPGFAGKRERLEARRTAPAAPADAPTSVAIVGAGVAGACAAHAFRRRGVPVTVYDAAGAPGAGASGNTAALVSPRLDRGDTGAARLHRAAYLAALDLYGALGVLDPVGVWRRGRDDAERAALQDLAADPPLPLSHLRAAAEGVLFPNAGVVRPRALLARLLDGVPVRTGAAVEAVAPGQAACGGADVVVLAAGAALTMWEATRWIPLALSRGQLEWAPRHTLDAARERGAYAAPHDGGLVFGATYDPVGPGEAVAPDDASRARNLAAVAALAPEMTADAVMEGLVSRASVRAATADRAPLAGPAPDAARFAADPDARHPGLWLLGGLGSRGFTLAPILAECLAARVCGEPPVLDGLAWSAVDPARFLHRARRRGALP
ncbi:MAG: tRNA (5-methylaminomethyl-2-thiouridine)(34)-methyltransferase MnmD [Hyphomonadaceae bacterium]|nr:tRNA (5-methylaminomethyl-2-thiouridine)(34)-methyltransferase MnmD [Hyphomonadaceae bacterium]